MTRPLHRLIGALVLAAACLAAPAARATDYTDLWFNPAESGWGVNVVQSDNFMFLTFFIYDDNHQPTWYSADLVWDGTKYTGGLFATRGTKWSLPWNPGDSPAPTQVGTASFLPDPTTAYRATLSYSVTGVGTVIKGIERQTLTTIALGGNYVGGQSGAYSSCSNASANYAYIDKFNLAVSQLISGQATLTFSYDTGATCTLQGILEQHGKLYRMNDAAYQCTGSLTFSTRATVYELKATSAGIEGRFSSALPSGCQENAQFGGAFVPQ
jgi:hypothetical protein